MVVAVNLNIDVSKINLPEEAMKRLANKKVRVGILNDSKNALKAARNELGFLTDDGRKVPPRSSVAMPITRFIKSIISPMQDVNLNNPQPTLDEIGERAVNVIENAFTTQGYGDWADNAPYTIGIKGRNEPLVDTGEMRGSYSYEVVNGTD